MILTGDDDGLHRELVAALLKLVGEGWNALLLSERVGLRKHRLYLTQVAFLKAPEVWGRGTERGKRQPPPLAKNNVLTCFRLLVRHVLDALLDFGESDRLAAVVEHRHHGVHAPEHLSQQLVLVRQGEAGWSGLGEGVVPLVRRQLSTAGRQPHTQLLR